MPQPPVPQPPVSQLPAVGTRVSVRHRLPQGSVPPLTDVVGHVERTGPTVEIRTGRGDLVIVDAHDVQAVRVIPEVPVRTSQIRNLEHAAALGWPGTEQHWVDGWLLRFGSGYTRRANSAIPLQAWASAAVLPAIVDWYAARDATPLLAIPDRLFRLPNEVPTDGENLVLVGGVDSPSQESATVFGSRPDDAWRSVDPRGVPDDVLTATVDGEVVFATLPEVAVARGAVTESPDGTRWVGLSAVHVTEGARGRGHGSAICRALLRWGREHGATRAYMQVLADNDAGLALFSSLGFTTQHRVRYVDARTL